MIKGHIQYLKVFFFSDLLLSRNRKIYDGSSLLLLLSLLRVYQCIDQLTAAQAELQDSVKELTKSRKKYLEAETMAQAVREKADQDAKYEPWWLIFSVAALIKGHRLQLVGKARSVLAQLLLDWAYETLLLEKFVSLII